MLLKYNAKSISNFKSKYVPKIISLQLHNLILLEDGVFQIKLNIQLSLRF